MLSPAGKEVAPRSKPKGSAAPPMKVVGLCELPRSIVLEPVDKIFQVSVRAVEHFPYAAILGVAFFRASGSIFCFVEGGGSKTTPESP